MKKNTSHLIPPTSYLPPPTSYRILLFPFSLIFGAIAALRRKAFQKKCLPSATFTVPTICVGNLRVGGTGKTPHVEYIANFLSQNYQTAILSRGYGRKTEGYVNAKETQNLSSELIGDEPMQYALKFPNIEIAVCEKRKTGIENLLKKNPKLEVIILDDAYQHLSVNYALKILLTEYQRPFFEDFPLPSGNLRECRNASKYADIIIVTKCPESLASEEKIHFLEKLKLQPHQEAFFTKINYEVRGKRYEVRGMGYEVEGETSHFSPLISHLTPLTSHLTPLTSHLLITGIANPTPLVHHLQLQYTNIHQLHFPDHHVFTNKDIEKIIRLKEELGGKHCTIITTEKDAMRLQAFKNMPAYQIIPIEIVFLENEAAFKEKLLSLLKFDYA